jgi:hypothetical protein
MFSLHEMSVTKDYYILQTISLITAAVTVRPTTFRISTQSTCQTTCGDIRTPLYFAQRSFFTLIYLMDK